MATITTHIMVFNFSRIFLFIRKFYRTEMDARQFLATILMFALTAASVAAQPELLPVGTNRPVRPLYFSVTAVDTNGLSSPWSNELVWTNGNNRLTNLYWTAPVAPAGLLDHYVLYWGFQSHVYLYSRALTSVTNQSWPLPQPPAIWQKTFSWLHAESLRSLSDSNNNNKIWVTNRITLCTVTGAPPGVAGFDRAGQIRWVRVQ